MTHQKTATSRVAVVGGTGDLGLGLASRLASSYDVVIGSRDASKARDAADKASRLCGRKVWSATNEEAASTAEAIILAIPDLPSDEFLLTLKPIATDKLVISPIVPMEVRDGLFVPKSPMGSASAAEKVSSLLQTRVAAAFHSVPAARLLDMPSALDYDVLVGADSQEVFLEASRLVSSIPRLRPLHAGPLSAARILEPLTPTLLNVGKLNKIKTPSIKVV